VISNCNRFSFTIASVTLEKEPTVLQRIEIRFSQASEKGSKSVGRSNCVANNYRTSVMIRVSVMKTRSTRVGIAPPYPRYCSDDWGDSNEFDSEGNRDLTMETSGSDDDLNITDSVAKDLATEGRRDSESHLVVMESSTLVLPS